MVNDKSTEVLPEFFGVRTMPKKGVILFLDGPHKKNSLCLCLLNFTIVIGGIIFVNNFKGYFLHLIHNEVFMKNHPDFLPVNVIYKLIHCVL